jgi:hypothetical protein
MAVPNDPACAICGQLHGLTMAELAEPNPALPVYCPACEARICLTHGWLDCVSCSHEPQGEAVRLFTPAPEQLPGQLCL